ncbi:MAG TPA: hypothetical protein VFE88_00235 [Candidatus Nanoarchaeia archaeon]|nr:hypothetical protein [Candidatus Nanoarchaeia archaeon]
MVICPRCDLVPDVFLRTRERHGMKDIPELLPSFKRKNVLADKEFDAEKFHEQIARVGGRSFVPPKYLEVPIWRTKGEHRKKLKKKVFQKSTHFELIQKVTTIQSKRFLVTLFVVEHSGNKPEIATENISHTA